MFVGNTPYGTPKVSTKAIHHTTTHFFVKNNVNFSVFTLQALSKTGFRKQPKLYVNVQQKKIRYPTHGFVLRLFANNLYYFV